MMPHRHPEDRIYTVISGVFYIGLGDLFDANGLTAHGPGSVVVLPGGQPHFHWARSGEYVTQVTAIGPLGLEYVDPAHDPGSAGHTALGETAVSNDCRDQRARRLLEWANQSQLTRWFRWVSRET